MSDGSTSDIDRLLDRLTAGISLLREQLGESLELDEFETRLFAAHDAVVEDYAMLRMSGKRVLSGTDSIDQFNIIRCEILIALQQLYSKLQLDVIAMKKQMRDNENAENDD